MIILLALVIILLPALILYACHKIPVLDKIGAIVLCYVAGIIIGNTGMLPAAFEPVQKGFLNFTVPLALPLLFFSLDIRRWTRLAGKSLLSFGLELIAVLVSATVAFLSLGAAAGPESWKVSGMLIGCYTGGSPNLAAIGTALRTEPTVYVAVNVADVIVPPIYLIMCMTVMQRLLLKILPAFKPAEGATGDAVNTDFTSYAGLRDRAAWPPLLAALGLAAVIFAAGGSLTLIVPEEYSSAATILAIASLGVAASFIPRVRRIPMTFQLGQYIIMVFCVAVSSLADLSKLVTTAPLFMAYVAIAVFLSAAIHVGLAWLFKIDADTVIITSIAGVFSPPFVPMVAAALKNREVIITGIITGIIGWVAGTYLGIIYAYFLRYVFM